MVCLSSTSTINNNGVVRVVGLKGGGLGLIEVWSKHLASIIPMEVEQTLNGEPLF